MTKKQIYILVAFGILLVIGIVSMLLTKSDNTPNLPPLAGDPLENTPFQEPPPYDLKTPSANTELSEPKAEAPANPNGGDSKLKIFDLLINSNGFSPEKIVVKQGDTVQINLLSQERIYDVWVRGYDVYGIANPGDNKVLRFDANTVGTFPYECKDNCPISKKIKGSLIVLP